MKSYLLDHRGVLLNVQRPVVDTRWGRYEGDCVIKLLPQGRLAELHEDFAFTTPDGRRITMSRGYISDGASIPRLLWTLVGSPFTGKYRWAAWPHDKLMQDGRAHPVPYNLRYAHHVLYQAARAGGTSRQRAATLELGVVIGNRAPLQHAAT